MLPLSYTLILPYSVENCHIYTEITENFGIHMPIPNRDLIPKLTFLCQTATDRLRDQVPPDLPDPS